MKRKSILKMLRQRRQQRNGKKSMPNLPTDVLINILGCIGDRNVWNIFITMNKAIQQASKSQTVSLPWPGNNNGAFKLGDRSYYNAGKEQFGISSDSQWLLWVTYTAAPVPDEDEPFQLELEVRLWNSKSGLQSIRRIFVEPIACTRRDSGFNCVKISKDLRYIAVFRSLEEAPIIRVYDLTVDGKITGFDRSNYVDLVCPDERVRYHHPRNLDEFSFTLPEYIFLDSEELAFDFTPDSKKLVVQYSYGSDNLWANGQHLMAVWDIENGAKWIASTVIPADGRLMGDFDAISNNMVIWTDTSFRFLGHPINEEGTSKIIRAWCFDSPGQAPTDITPPCFNPQPAGRLEFGPSRVAGMRIVGSSVNPTDQTIFAVTMEELYYRRGDKHSNSRFVVALLRVDPSGLQTQLAASKFKIGYHSRNKRKGGVLYEPLRASVAWFPDGQHIAFISESGTQIMLYKVRPDLDFDRHGGGGIFQNPRTSSLPGKLIKKANTFAAREIKKSTVMCKGRPRATKYISRFDLSPNGEALTLVLSTIPSIPSTPLIYSIPFIPTNDDEALETPYLISM